MIHRIRNRQKQLMSRLRRSPANAHAHKQPLTEYEVLRAEFRTIHGAEAPDAPVAPNLESLVSPHSTKSERDRAQLAAFQSWLSSQTSQLALCLSGGGIRSATFCLGVLQALARAGQLEKFHYLSTVSGGGYIGGWLSAWLQRDGNAIDKLRQSSECEPPQISGLRKQSNYLAPRRGWSADTWTLISLYSRNLVLNWLVLIPLILSVLLIPRITLATLSTMPGENASIITAVLAVALLALAISLVAMSLPSADKWQVAEPKVPRLIPWTLAFSGFLFTYAYSGWKSVFFHTDVTVALTTSLVAHAIALVLFAMYLLLAKDSNGKLKITTQSRNSINRIVGWTILGFVITAITTASVLWFALRVVLPLLETNPYSLTIVAVPYFLLSYSLVGAVWILFASPWTQETDREWWATSGGNAFALAILWVGLHGLVYFGPSAFFWLTGTWTSALAVMGGLAGVMTTLGGYWGKRQLRTDGANGNPLLKALADRSLQVGSLFFILVVFGIGGSLSIELLVSPSSTHPAVEPVTVEQIALTRYAKALDKLEALIKALTTDDAYKPSVEITTKAAATQLLKDSLAKIHDAKLASQKDFAVVEKPDAVVKNVREIVETAAQNLAADIQRQNGEQGLKPDATRILREQAIEELRLAAHREVTNVSGWFGYFLSSINRHMVSWKNEYEAHLLVSETRFQLIPFLSKLLPGWPQFAISLIAMALILSLFVGVNRYSLHALYANRLTRAYLGVSNPNKRIDPLTALNRTDDLKMCTLPGKVLSPNSVRLFPIVNAALNLAKSDHLEWQQRKASSFTFSPLHSGSWLLGYQDTSAYTSDYHGGVTLGQAIGISGAAVSPNMGYHSSTLVSSVMTFFNARLGQWFPNPGPCGQRVWHKSEPLFGVWPLTWEMLGNTTDRKKWVNLSDGGHFDNLGLYEMVKRRCKRILVIDASADPEYRYEDLSTAIRLVRADMDVTIEFPQTSGPSRQLPPMGEYSIGTIKYPDSTDEGLLVYVKPVLTGKEPVDLIRYFAEHSTTGGDKFPHQSTADQFFNEAQFESYRTLGYHQGNRLFQEITDFEQFDPDILSFYYPKVALAEAAFTLSTLRAAALQMSPSSPIDNSQRNSTLREGSREVSHTDILNRTAGAFQSWSTATVLGTALTIGGIVGVTGTVALGPGGQVTLTNASVPLEIRQEDRDFLRVFRNPSQTQDSSTENAFRLSTAIDKLTKTVASDDTKEATLSSSVGILSGKLLDFSNRIPSSRAGLDQNELKKLIAEAMKNELSGKVDTNTFTTEIKELNNKTMQLREFYQKDVTQALQNLNGGLTKIEKAVSGVGPRRSAIEGREGGR